MKYVCKIKGIAIKTIWKKLFAILFDCKPNNITMVSNKEKMENGLSFWIILLIFFLKNWRIKIDAINGITINNSTDVNKVSYGTTISETCNRNPAIGAKAKSIIKSFTETWISV